MTWRERLAHRWHHGTWQCYGSIVAWQGRDARVWVALYCHSCHRICGAHPIPEHVYL